MNQKYLEFINELKTKRIAIIGAGVSNLPLIKILTENNCNITVFDQKELTDMEDNTRKYLTDNNITTSLGNNYLENIKEFDVIFRSPSFLPTNPYLVKEAERGALITTEIEQVIKLAPCPIIGVTGSKGKTTTTTILNDILKGLGYSTYLGGNIGTPLFSKLNEMKSTDIVVLELSSFQLMNMPVSPQIAVVTNISPDHLDIHGSYEEYINAKKNLFLNQMKDDILVLNADDEIVSKFREDAKGEVRYFKNISIANNDIKDINNNFILNGKMIEYNGKVVIDTTKLLLKGNHNYLNICAALNAIKDYINIPYEELEAIIKDIKSVPHRLEFVRNINNVKWYNDSASTTPDKSLAGLYAFDEDIVLIAGGYDKNISYEPMAKPILERVSKLILFGDTKDKIYRAVMNESRVSGKSIPIYVMDTLEEVIEVANKVSIPGEVVLFSPASASFDMFKNAYQRGDLFKSFVEKL
ncbi:MAG: UDP-N-acetylmuramoyl-L-alanine--D-glutamate ligase [Bacilli bacterium]|nr:UDP-N-acetylmuramoyl-L-alanine--D-glutamate ligase [Bacilli bacterium]